jgi:hypothetical protein
VYLYIDATAGGVLVQVLLGGFAGIAVVGRLIWSRLPGVNRRDDASAEVDDDADLAA